MDRLTESQVANNRDSRGRWDTFRAHRGRVTELLCRGSSPGRSRLCVLGAGNCNDLDLAALLAAHREVHLVDLDAGALAHGAAAQGVEASPALVCHGGVDVTGALGRLAAWSPAAPVPDDDLRACADEPVRRVAPALGGPFDVVGSTGLLSQLMLSVVSAAGEGNPRFVEALRAVRAGHLRLLAHLAAPGGHGVLVTDVVSSDTAPGLASVAEASLAAVLAGLVQAGNFFHGVNPAVLAHLVRADPVLAGQAEAPEMPPPWLWDLGPRVYAVCALRFRKKGTPPAA
jgi:hypothetical protein